MACAPPTWKILVTPDKAAATKIAGLNFSCGGVTIYISGTPAIFAGKTFIKTLDG